MVISLGAGLDARPYRMVLPSSLKWIEVDLPQILAYKEHVLANEKPACALQRVPLDLSDVRGRRELFQHCGGEARSGVVVTEALLLYLTEEEVGSLARDLADVPSFRRWITDVGSPRLLRMLQKKMGQLRQAGAKLKFAAMPQFFAHHGWEPVDVRSMLKTAAGLKRLPFIMRLVSMLLPDSPGPEGKRPWSAVCLLAKRQKK